MVPEVNGSLSQWFLKIPVSGPARTGRSENRAPDRDAGRAPGFLFLVLMDCFFDCLLLVVLI